MLTKAPAVPVPILLIAAVLFTGGFLAGQSPQISRESLIIKHFSDGRQAITNGRYAQAAQEFKEVLRLDPNLSQARINLGLAYHLMGDYEQAAAELEKGLAQSPNVAGGNVILGIDELKLGHPSKSIPPLKRALRIDPSNQQALQTLAAVYAALGNYRDANRGYAAAFDKGPKQAGDWLILGKAYLGMAKQLGVRMVHNYPDSSWHDRLTGDLLSERGRWSDAARKYQSAIDHDRRQPGLHASLGKTLLMQGKLDDARNEFQSELRLDPGNPSAELGLAEVDLAQGQSRTALAAIQHVAEVSPKFLAGQSDFPSIKISPDLATRMASEMSGQRPEAGLHFLLSVLYRIGGQAALARDQQDAFESSLKRLLEQEPARQASPSAACKAHQYEACERLLSDRKDLDASQYEALGRAFFALRDDGRASDSFASALALNNADPALTYWLLRTYIQLANYCFVQLTHRFGGSPQARELQAEYYRMTGADSKAAQEYEAALKMEPRNASLYLALGEIALKQHNLPAAGRYARQALEIDPSNPLSLCLMGRIAIGTAHPVEAISYLQKALQYDPNYLPAHASLGIAYLHSGNAAAAVRELNQSTSLDIYGDLHYMLYKAYQQIGKQDLAKNALAVSESLRRRTAATALARISSLEGSQ